MARVRNVVLSVIVSAFFTQIVYAETIDQQNSFYSGYLGPSSHAGQSFTPTLPGINFASFTLATDPGTESLVYVALYQGSGFGGAVLAATPDQLITDDTSFEAYTFDFSTTVALTPGDVYTLALIVENAPPGTLDQLEGSGNPYSAGVEYNSDGVAQTNYDMVFSEGVFATPVPEPTSLRALCVGLALFAAAGCLRRFRKLHVISK